MRSDAILVCVTLGTLAVTSTGCSQAPPPPFEDSTGEAKNAVAEYPAGPYGVGVGSIIANYDFVGYQDAMTTTATMQPLSLSDFYNPHAHDATYQPAAGEQDDRLFPADSGYNSAGKPKPTVLLIDIASVWCGPCNEEAATILPAKHASYLPCGGEFLLDLHDSATPGSAATPANLRNWTKMYKVNYPAAIDPAYTLDKIFAADAFPNNYIVDTTTMKIVATIAGEAVGATCGNYSICSVDSDCQSCSGGMCGDGSTCTADADCQAKTCTTFPFWVQYESLLDKTRTGCTLK